MNRLGWIVFAVIVAVIGFLAATVRIGPGPATVRSVEANAPADSPGVVRVAAGEGALPPAERDARPFLETVEADMMPTTMAPEAVPRGEDPVATFGAPPALIIPVDGVARDKLYDSWGDARGDGTRAHQGIDIMAPSGSRVIAAGPGKIEKLFFSNGGGGVTLYQRSPDGDWGYYYAHLGGYAPGVREGMRVKAGDLLGYVGDTGNAGAGNHHLHFGVSHYAPDERWHQGTPIDPYPLLAGGRAGG